MKIENHAQRGEWAELRFMAKAMEHGYKITKPLGGSTSYDVVVDLGGRFTSVQVKSTTYMRRRGVYETGRSFSLGLRAINRQPYSNSAFQYLAAYIIPREVWYIIPFPLVCGRQSILLCPDGAPDIGFEPYREAWHLLQEMPNKPWPPLKRQHYRLAKRHSPEPGRPEAPSTSGPSGPRDGRIGEGASAPERPGGPGESL